MIFRRRGAQQFGEDRLQPVRPYLIAADCRMQFVRIHHSCEEAAVRVRQLVIHIQEPNVFFHRPVPPGGS